MQYLLLKGSIDLPPEFVDPITNNDSREYGVILYYHENKLKDYDETKDVNFIPAQIHKKDDKVTGHIKCWKLTFLTKQDITDSNIDILITSREINQTNKTKLREYEIDEYIDLNYYLTKLKIQRSMFKPIENVLSILHLDRVHLVVRVLDYLVKAAK
jgi:hypothetical protein